MDRDLAEALMRQLNEVSATFKQIATQIERVDSEEKKGTMRRGLASMMSTLYTDLIFPVLLEHPELDPERDGSAAAADR